MGDTAIRWTDKTWNPVVGCNQVSPGCAHCYAKTLHDMRHRAFMAGKDLPEQYAVPFEQVQLKPERLDYPLHWRQPARIFVNSVSDLFHEDIPEEFIWEVFAVMSACQRHIFQILTKRPDRMLALLSRKDALVQVEAALGRIPEGWESGLLEWPLPNIWLGTSVENQHWADIRIPLLLQVPAVVRFLSCEPLLGPVDLSEWLFDSGIPVSWQAFSGDEKKLHWVIVGGESGKIRRPMKIEWARSIRDVCLEADVAFFFKQMGGAKSETGQELDGQRWEQMPEIAA